MGTFQKPLTTLYTTVQLKNVMRLNMLSFNLKSISTLTIASVLAISPSLLNPRSAVSQPTDTLGTRGHYIGAGVSAGVTNGGQDGDAATFGGNIQGRYAVPNAPVSLRGSLLFSKETTAIIPTISYDLPITKSANAYFGVGYSFVEKDGKPTPLGNKDAVVLTLGGEMEVARNIMVYGDTKFGIRAYENSPASALSLQTGVAYKF